MDQLMVGFMTIMEPLNFLSVFVGVLGGMIIGAMPGLTAPMGVALLIPFTYGMMPVPAGEVNPLSVFAGSDRQTWPYRG